MALAIYIAAVLLLPAVITLIATLAILAIAVASIWARHHLQQQIKDFEDRWGDFAEDLVAQDLPESDDQLEDNPVAAIGGVPR